MASQIVDTRLPELLPQKQQRAGQSEGDSTHARSWQREMERAQMELWLGNGVVGYKPLAGVAGGAGVAGVAGTTRVMGATGVTGLTPAPTVDRSAPQSETGTETDRDTGATSIKPMNRVEVAPDREPTGGPDGREVRDGIFDDGRDALAAHRFETTARPEYPGVQVLQATSGIQEGIAGPAIGARDSQAQDAEQAALVPVASRAHGHMPSAGGRFSHEVLAANPSKKPWQAGPYTERKAPEPGEAAAYTVQMVASLQPIASVEVSASFDGVELPAPLPVSMATGPVQVQQGAAVATPAPGQQQLFVGAATASATPAVPGWVAPPSAPRSSELALAASAGSGAVLSRSGLAAVADLASAAPSMQAASLAAAPAQAAGVSPAVAPSATASLPLQPLANASQTALNFTPQTAATLPSSPRAQAQPAERASRSGPATAAARDAGPIRLHADWTGNGVRLWLGMNAELLPQLQAIATQLQTWVSAQGFRLLGISCNGRELGDDRSITDLFESASPGAADSHPDHRTREIS